MRRHSDLHQSAAISAVLLVLLFALPLAVVVPFRTELFSDDPTAVEWNAPRVPIVIALTYAEGDSFPYKRVIEAGDGYAGERNIRLNHTFHYPSIIQSRDGAIHVSYTWHGKDCIMYHRISEAWIKGEQ